MEHRRLGLRALVLAVATAAVLSLLPSRAEAARLHFRVVGDRVVIRLVGSRAHAIRYTLGHHTVAHRRRAPFNVVLYGYAPAHGRAKGKKVKLFARARSGRILAAASLRRTWKPAKPGNRPFPTVAFTSTPPDPTSSASATLAFGTRHASATSCSLDGAPFVACSSPVSFNGLALGRHTLMVVVSNPAAIASATAGWSVIAPPAEPPPPTGNSIAPVVAPSPYLPPPTAQIVYTSAELNQALGGTTKDIVVADGVYDNDGPFLNPNGDRIFAQHLGGAVFKAGFSMGGNWGPGNGVLQGLAFDVSDPGKVLENSIVHIWGTGSGTQVLDTTFKGHGVIGAGIMARQVEGVVVRRVVARDFRDYGVIADPNASSYTPATPPVLEDVDSANVSWPSPGASNGTAEACVWVGVKAVVRRVKARNCAWEGLWVGTGTRDSVFQDVDVDDAGIGVYVEHFASNTTFRRIHAGPNVERGLTCEWADPAWGSRPACSDDVVESSYFDTKVIGVYLDEGTTRTTVRDSVFVHQRCGAIGNYDGVGNLWDTKGNDYRGIAGSAVPVWTRHLYSC
jgi:hypothetical protein